MSLWARPVIEFDGRDEETLAEAIALTRTFSETGLDLLNVSIGFSTRDAKVPWQPAFLAPIAARVRREAGIPVATAWGIDAPADAERAVAEQQPDLAMIALSLPVARELGVPKASSILPEQYAYWLAPYPGPQKQEPIG